MAEAIAEEKLWKNDRTRTADFVAAIGTIHFTIASPPQVDASFIAIAEPFSFVIATLHF